MSFFVCVDLVGGYFTHPEASLGSFVRCFFIGAFGVVVPTRVAIDSRTL